MDITNKGQHGFKTGKSNNTAGQLVQSLISRALDKDDYALLAFDVVNVKLLIKRMRTIGLPEDLIILVEEWLKTRYHSKL